MAAQEETITGGMIVGPSGWKSGFFNGTKVRTFAENNSVNIEVVGKFGDLTQPKTGEQVPSAYASYLPAVGTSGNIWGVQNSTLTNGEGGISVLNISCVEVASLTGAYDETWDIDMQEVQRSLKQHPKVLDDSDALRIIQLWEATPEAKRVYTSGSSIRFRYYNTTESDPEGVLTDVASGSVAEDYLKAVTAGIETYNVYLPVVTRQTKYLKITEASGSTVTIPYSDKIGKFDTPSVLPSGYTGTDHWFKSTDKYSRANNGTWSRTEAWTYTDDTTHKWIYQELT